MKDMLLKLYIKVQDLLTQEEGQDLVEYALIVALIALAATAGIKTVGTSIAGIFTSINSSLSTST